MNICVIGCGYVGIVTGVVFSDLGNDVVCVDINQKRIETLQAGRCPIYEPGLPELLERNSRDGRIKFSTSTEMGVQSSEIIFISVGTPPLENGETDLSQVKVAATEIGKAIQGPKIVVNKSTVPVGTGDIVRKVIESVRKNRDPFQMVSNPEFLREGQAVWDTLHPDRIIIGTSSSEAADRLCDLYRPLGRPFIITDIHSAEMIKYASNAFLATKISFINAVADLCEEVGGDVRDVAKGLGADERIGPAFLGAGLGYGGSCFPKDVDSLLHASIQIGTPFGLLKETTEKNADRVPRFVRRIVDRLGDEGPKPLAGKKLSVLGLSFKAETDDMREAKSIEICQLLREAGARIRAYDPIAIENARAILGEDGVDYFPSAYEAVREADAAIIVTDWREFIQLNLRRLADSLSQPIIFDGRNIYSAEEVVAAGIEYHSIGRSTVVPTKI